MSSPFIILAVEAVNWFGMLAQCAFLLLLVALSGTFSGSETVLFALSPGQLQTLESSDNPFRQLAARLMKQPRRTLTTILMGNTAVNVLLFAVSYVVFRDLAKQVGAWVTPVAGAVSVLLVVVVGEVAPKALGVTLALKLAPYSAAVVQISGYVLAPLGRILDGFVVEPMTRLIFGRSSRRSAADSRLSTIELKTLLEMSRRDGLIDRVENLYLREVIDLHQLRVRDIMIPRVEVEMFDVNGDADELRALMRRTRLTKAPVYDGAVDEIVGLVYAKILFFEPDKTLRELVSPVRYVPEVISGEQLLQHFRRTGSQLAIVVDEHGGMAGLVTLEDVLEEIVGKIHAPKDREEAPEIQQISESEYEISGQLSLHYWVELFNISESKERVATVAGLVTACLGRPACQGESVTIGNVRLTVAETDGPRILRLKLVLLDELPNERGRAAS